MNSIKILSLNLWGFNDWEHRLPEIINNIKKEDPDIVCIQEAQKDVSKFLEDQISIINKDLRFPNAKFEVATIKTTKNGIPLENPFEHGLGVLSKFPTETEVVKLKREAVDTEDRIILRIKITLKEKAYVIYNVHFSNQDKLAELHFKETLEIARKRDEVPIIVGDFNVKNLSQYKDTYDSFYKNSADVFSYISYPKDNLSYDYFLIPNKYDFLDFKCLDNYLSDHRAIKAEIDLK